MKSLLALLILVFSISVLQAKVPEILNEPDYEYRTTAVFNVSSIERTPDATLLRAHLVFRPHWWVIIDSTATLSDPVGGVSYPLQSAEGLTLCEQFWMPESGEHDIVLHFPPLPDGLETVDFSGGAWKIIGLRLDGKKAEKEHGVTPEEWLKQNNKSYSGESPEFFKPGKSRLHGFINGYDPRCGFKNILLYISDLPTGTDCMEAIEINDDGSFEKTIELGNPGMYYMSYGSVGPGSKVYLEPGRDLAVYLDWEDMLQFEITSGLQKLTFGDELGAINNEIRTAPSLPFMVNQATAKTDDPMEIAGAYKATYDETSARLEDFIADGVSAQAAHILRQNLKGAFACQLLDFDMLRNYRFGQANDSIKPTPVEFYSAIGDIFKENAPWFIVNGDMSTLNNRLAYSNMFEAFGACQAYIQEIPEVNGVRLLQQNGVETTEEEEKFSDWLDMNAGKKIIMNQAELDEYIGNLISLIKKYQENKLDDEVEKWNKVDEKIGSLAAENAVYNIAAKVNATKKYFGLQNTPLLLQLAATAKICNFGHVNFRGMSPDYPETITKALTDRAVVDNPYILGSMRDFFERGFESIKGYRLPDDERGRIISDIIKPHEGKMLVLDMWATTCGPCRANIQSTQRLREANLNHPDFKYIFITGEEESPQSAYDSYVAEHLKGEECHRLSQVHFNRLRDLFNFNGIPRYILIDRDGTILDDNYALYNLKSDLSSRGISLNEPAGDTD